MTDSVSRYFYLIWHDVNVLDLEESNRPKRRITGQGYHFKLLRIPIAPISLQGPSASRAVSTPAVNPPKHDQNGIPSIRTTAPGDEIADFAKLRPSKPVPQVSPALSTAGDNSDVHVNAKGQSPSVDTKSTDLPKQARRFHLTRDLSSSYDPSKPTGIRKKGSRGSSIRPPMPTFVERQPYNEVYTKPPVDKILYDSGQPASANGSEKPPPKDAETVAPFTKSKPSTSKSGVSINEPSATWNRESDQLADELAALAMELDPDIEPHPSPPRPSRSPQPPAQPSEPPPQVAPGEDDFIYETYIRMTDDKDEADTLTSDPVSMNVGVLVIDEEDEDMWEGYMQSDEDSDEDEEDSNGEWPLIIAA